MIEVDLPDGSVAEFPDGTPPDVIKSALQKKFGAPQQQAPESQMSRDLRGELSAMTQNPAKGQYDALPGWQKPIVAASDIATLVGDGATFGYGDKAAAWARSKLTGNPYDAELQTMRNQTEGARNRAGSAGLAAEITGAVALPIKTGATLSGRFGTSAMTGAKGLGARTGLMAAEGAGYGAASAAGHDQNVGTGAMIGALGGAGGNVVGEGISAGVGKIASKFNKVPPVPTSGDWKSKADAAFGRARAQGAVFTKKGLDDLETKLNTFLVKRGYWPDNQPGIKGGLAMIKDYQDRGGNVTLEGLQALRQRFAGGYVMGNKNNNAMVREAIDLIDNLLERPQPGFVAASGDPRIAGQAYREGMKASRNQHKLEDVEYLINKGQRQGDRNIIDNSNKRVKALLSDKLLDPRSPMSRGWNQTEKDAIKKASTYGIGERAAHAMSGLAPQGMLTGMAHMATAAGTGGASIPFQLGAAGVGFASGKVADSLARKPVVELARLIANGGIPPAQVQNVVQRLAQAKREALSRALMALGVVGGQQAIGQQ
jgi:hypothetical protein